MAESIEHVISYAVGLGGSLIGIHLSLAVSAALLLAITLVMLWPMVPSR